MVFFGVMPGLGSRWIGECGLGRRGGRRSGRGDIPTTGNRMCYGADAGTGTAGGLGVPCAPLADTHPLPATVRALETILNTAIADLSPHVVLVTGGARGLGAAISRAFLGQGARVVVNYHRSRDAA